MKTSQLTGRALDYAVALAEGLGPHSLNGIHWDVVHGDFMPYYSIDSAGDDIIDRLGITVIRCDDDYGTDAQGFTTNKHTPVWAATLGQHSAGEYYGSQGDYWGTAYSLNIDDMTYGPTRRIAAMRAYVALKLGDEIEIPGELS